MPTFKTEEQIYNTMKQAVLDEADLPLTNWSAGSVIAALLKVIASALRLCYIVLQALYFNIFPQDADRESLKRYYELWDLDWDNPDTEIARNTVLNKYREKSIIGTAAWYENTVVTQFASIVNQATCLPNYRGPGTVDLLVKRNNAPIYESDLETIRAYFAQDANKVMGADLIVRTREEDAS